MENKAKEWIKLHLTLLLMLKDEKLDYNAKSSCLDRFVDGVEASLVSGVQGLDQKKNFQPFIGLVRVKECISGILGMQGI